MATTPSFAMPDIHLLCMHEKDINAFEAACKLYEFPSQIKVTIHNERLNSLPADLRFDAIVSPANSYAQMDGGFDDALSRALSAKYDYFALTRVAKAAVYKESRGLALPGSCLLIDLLDQPSLKTNDWNCRYLALCPTMKTPQAVTWDREIVFECIWALLAAIDRHNRNLQDAAPSSLQEEEHPQRPRKISSLLMTPMATACGKWSSEKWAAQMVLAIRQFTEAAADVGTLMRMEPAEIMQHAGQVEATHNL